MTQTAASPQDARGREEPRREAPGHDPASPDTTSNGASGQDTPSEAQPAARQPSHPGGEPLLEAEGLCLAVPGPAGPRQVLHDLSLGLRAGELVAVTGRTGTGKSTLLRLLAGVLRPQTGSVRWQGTPLEGLGPEQVTRMRAGFLGYLDQGVPVIEGLTALEAVMVGAGPLRRSQRAQTRQRARQAAHRLGLDLVLDHEVRTLSGGERQRVGLASLITAQPRLLLLDEPSSALDEATTRQLIAYLQELVAQGTGVLVATHDPLVVEAADQVLPLD